MKYLYIEKRQNIVLTNPWPKRAMRFIQEFKDLGLEHDVVYNDSFSINLVDGNVAISFDGKALTDYTHVIFGGHRSETRWDYEVKVIVAQFIKKHNSENSNSQIKLQNIDFMLNFPYYDKIQMAAICMLNDIPHLNTYYRRDGMYDKNIDKMSGYPTITKHVWGVNDRIPNPNKPGKTMVKKTVYRVEDTQGWQQERLKEKDLSQFFIQEYSPAGEDYRIFVSKGKVVGGWKRISLDDSFMTVGGERKYELYNSPAKEMVEACEKASKAWGVDFMALDFIYKGDTPVVLEFSMHPGFNAYENKCEPGKDSNSKEPINVAKTIIESF